MSHVQLSSKESVVIYRDPDSKRILGFGPENAKPTLPAGQKYTTELCLHAAQVERRVAEYRDQCHRDSENSTVRKIESDRPLRQAFRDAILERNSQVDAWNRDVNMALLKCMDTFYQRSLDARLNAEVALVAEKYDASATAVDLAKQSSHVRSGDLKHV